MGSSHDEKNEAESHGGGKPTFDEEEKRKMHDNLHNLMVKYEKMAKRIRSSSSIDDLLNTTNLPCSADIMIAPLSLKFKVPQIEPYDGYGDPIEQLETFKAHMTPHGFWEEVACQVFPLTIKEVARA